MRVSRKKLIQDVTYFNMVCFGLLGAGVAGMISNYVILPFFFIFGLIGYWMRPYNKNGEYRF